MTQIIGKTTHRGGMVLSVILAIVLGVLAPILTIYQIMLPMALPCAVALFAVVLYARNGIVPAALLGAVSVVMTAFFMGLYTLPMLLLYVPIPIVAVMGIRRRAHFFKQMGRAALAGIAGALLAMPLSALLFGSNLIADLIGEIGSVAKRQMPLLWAATKEYSPALGATMTYAEFENLYVNVLKILQQYYEQNIAANLLTGAALTAVLSVLWGNWIAARHGEATSESFIGVSEWHLPRNMTLGLLMTLAAAFVLSRTSINGATLVWNAVSALIQLAFVIQALANDDFRRKSRGASRSRRGWMIVLTVLIFALFGSAIIPTAPFAILAAVGILSALFGRNGVIQFRVITQDNDDHSVD